jgi:putative ABC transport system permease protein
MVIEQPAMSVASAFLRRVLGSAIYDWRLACRGLRRDWMFTLAAVAMLALAIGLNTTIFIVMNAMVFRGLPLAPHSDRLAYIEARKPSGQRAAVSYADFDAWRSQTQAFDGLAFSGPAATLAFRNGNGRPIDMLVPRISANTFAVVGVRPIIGRDFLPADEAPGAAPVAILNYAFWESQFGKRLDALGATVYVNGAAVTIVGVMPEGFTLVYEQNLWMPLTHTPGLRGDVFGRLRDGATFEGARAELDTINRRLAAADPATDRDVLLSLLTYSQGHVGPDAPMIYGSLWAGAWFVLLIACANLASLALARTIGRWREFSTRIALGASQGRMMGQVLMESLTLGAIAGPVAWWITNWNVRTWAAATATRYLALDYSVDAGILAYLIAVMLAAVLLYSVAPIGRVLQIGASGALKGDARGVTQGLRGRRLAAGLVAAQMALAIVLLSGAGVLVRSFDNIVGAETGVRDPETILVGSMHVPSDTYQTPQARLAYFERLQARLQTIPGVDAVSLASVVPVNGAGTRQLLEIEGKPNEQDRGPYIQFVTVGGGYFGVVGAALTSGRDFNDGDRLTSLPVAIVNERFASTYWPGEQPIGKRLRMTPANAPDVWRAIVGVVPNIMQGDPVRQRFDPVVYLPFAQGPMTRAWNSLGCCFRGANFLVRTSVPADRVAQAVRAEAQNVDLEVSLEEFATLKARFAFNRDLMDVEHAELGKHAAAAPVFALIALLLSAIGLSAVIAHSVTQRTQEIGVRMAIGAAARDVRRMVLREGMRPVAIGLVIGFVATPAVNRLLQSQLVGLSPYDPMTMATAPLVLIVVGLLACLVPARRAMHVDPVVALRHD